MRRPVTEMNRDTKHRTVRCRVSSCLWVWSAACAALVMTGCGAEPARFSLNLVHLHSQDADESTLSPTARKNIATVRDALYGTPDAPRLPPLPEPDVLNFLEISKLQRAAGALVLGAHVLPEVLLALLRRLACPLWGTAESLHDLGRHQLPQPLRVVHEVVELVHVGHRALVIGGRAARRRRGRRNADQHRCRYC